MASSSIFALPLVVFSLLAVSAAARPCKTLFFITTSTSSYHLHFPNPNPIPNFFFHNPDSISPRFRTFFVTTIAGDPTRFGHLSRPSIFFRRSDPIIISRPDPVFFDRVEDGEDEELENRIPMEFYSSVKSSIRDRTKDIMRVVGALLFGVGCGALTAATMYLIWSLFWPNHFDSEDSSDDDFDDCDMKTMGYVSIPSKVVNDDLKKPAAPAAAPAKEVV